MLYIIFQLSKYIFVGIFHSMIGGTYYVNMI